MPIAKPLTRRPMNLRRCLWCRGRVGRCDGNLSCCCCKAGARASCLTLFVNGDPILSQIEWLLGEVYKVGCPSGPR